MSVVQSTDGRIELDGTAIEGHHLRIVADDYESQFLHDDEVAVTGADEAVILLKPLGHILIDLRGESGRPIEDAAVELTYEPASPRLGWVLAGIPANARSRSGRSSATGRVVLKNTPSDIRYRLEVVMGGRVQAIRRGVLDAATGDGPIVVTVASRPRVVAGTLETADGALLTGKRICAVEADDDPEAIGYPTDTPAFAITATDQSGQFRFEDLPCGIWWLGLEEGENVDSRAARSSTPLWRRFDLTAPELHEVRVNLPPSRVLSGVVRNREGEGVPGARVLLMSENVAGIRTLWSDDAGAFQAAVAAGDTCYLYAAHDSILLAASAVVRAGHRGEVIVAPAPSGVVNGHVVNRSGKSSAVHVVLAPLVPGLPRRASMTADGAFSIADVAPGKYQLLAWGPGRAVGFVDSPLAVTGDGSLFAAVVIQDGAELRVVPTETCPSATVEVWFRGALIDELLVEGRKGNALVVPKDLITLRWRQGGTTRAATIRPSGNITFQLRAD